MKTNNTGPDLFSPALEFLDENPAALSGAAHDVRGVLVGRSRGAARGEPDHEFVYDINLELKGKNLLFAALCSSLSVALEAAQMLGRLYGVGARYNSAESVLLRPIINTIHT